MKKRVLYLALVLALAAPLALLLFDFSREALAIPFMRLLWFARLFARSVPQLLCWNLFVLLALALALQSLIRTRRAGQRKPEVLPEREGRVRELMAWIRRAEDSEYHHWSLQQHAGALLLKALARRERATPVEVRQRLLEGDLDVPESVRAFLCVGPTPRFSRPGHLLRRLLQPQQDVSATTDLQEMIHFLEAQLEIEQ